MTLCVDGTLTILDGGPIEQLGEDCLIGSISMKKQNENGETEIEGVFDDIASGVLSYFPEKRAMEFLDEIRFFGKLRFNQGVKETLKHDRQQRTKNNRPDAPEVQGGH